MRLTTTWMMALGLLAWSASPSFANCGHCGSGSAAGEEKHAHGATADDHSCCAGAMKAGLRCGDCTAEGKAKAAVGKKAYDFGLKDLEGKDRRLSDYAGKTVVLVWTNPDCPFVQRHFKEGTLNKLAESFDSKKVAVLAIDSTANATPEKIGKAEKDSGVKVTTLVDPEGKVGRIYNAQTTPHVFVIDPKGKLAYAGAIDNDPRGELAAGKRENYAAEAVKAAMAGQAPPQPTTKPYGCSVKYRQKT